MPVVHITTYKNVTTVLCGSRKYPYSPLGYGKFPEQQPILLKESSSQNCNIQRVRGKGGSNQKYSL